MILKFTQAEYSELMRHDVGPYGDGSFESFLAEICARTNEDTREVDIGRDERERIEGVTSKRHKEIVAKVFMRPLEEAYREFFD